MPYIIKTEWTRECFLAMRGEYIFSVNHEFVLVVAEMEFQHSFLRGHQGALPQILGIICFGCLCKFLSAASFSSSA